MDHELIVPATSDGSLELTITRWLVEVGQTVKKGQDLVEATTEKIALYVPAPVNGVLTEVRVQVGDKVNVGDVVGTVRGE